MRAVLRGCHKRLRELNGPGYVSFDGRRNSGRPRFPSCRPSRLESVAAIGRRDMEAVDRIKDAAGLVVAAIRHPMAGDTKSADQHWKLTGSPLARFLM